MSVLVRSNVAYAQGMSIGVWASHSGGGTELSAQSTEPWLTDGELGNLYVAPRAGRQNGPLTVRVAMGLRGKPAAECTKTADLTDCIVAQKTLSFIPQTRLRVPVVLYAVCAGVKCSDDSTCSALGTCVPDRVDPRDCATPEGCSLPDEPRFAGVPRDAGSEPRGQRATRRRAGRGVRSARFQRRQRCRLKTRGGGVDHR